MSVGSVEASRSTEQVLFEPSRNDSQGGSFESSLMDILDSGASLREDGSAEREPRSEQEPPSAQEQRAEEDGRVEEDSHADESQVSDETQRIDGPAEPERADETAIAADPSAETSLALESQSLDPGSDPSVTDQLLEQILERTREYLSFPERDPDVGKGSERIGRDGARTGATDQPTPAEARNTEAAPRQVEAEARGTHRPDQPQPTPEDAVARNPQPTSEQQPERPGAAESRPVQPDSPARSVDTQAGESRGLKLEQVASFASEPRSDLGGDRRDPPEREEPAPRDSDRAPRATTATAITAENLVESERVRSLAAASPTIETQLDPGAMEKAASVGALPIEVAAGAPVESAEPRAPASPSRPMPPEAIPQHIEWLVARGGGSAEIQLHPPELGRMSIQVIVRGDDVRIVMNVQEGSAQTLVAEYRESLENSLASKDLKLDQFEVRDWANRDGSATRDDRDRADSERGNESSDQKGQSGPRGVASALLQPSRGNEATGDDRINLRV